MRQKLENTVDVAIVSASQLSTPNVDDPMLLEALAQRGCSARIVAWDDAAFDWARAKIAVLRSTWNYVQNADRFAAWLREVETQTTLINSAEIALWNMRKTYLQGLQRAGIATIATHFVLPGETADLATVMTRQGWSEVVIKPVLSAGSLQTLRVSVSDLARGDALLQQLRSSAGAMIQPYLQSVEQGELSLVLIEGEFCYAVRKKPKPFDFRVQVQFGGSYEPAQPAADELAFAKSVWAALPATPVYARVDVLRDDTGRVVLLELEAIEPALYFNVVAQGAHRLAEALVRRLEAPLQPATAAD